MASLVQSPILLKPSLTKPNSFVRVFSSVSVSVSSYGFCGLKMSNSQQKNTRLRAAAEDTLVASSSSQEGAEGARRLYIGNIPRNLTNDQLRNLLQDHAAPEIVEVMYDKYSGRSRRFGFATMKTVEDANAVVDKLDGTEVGGRKIKVNVTEKPMDGMGSSVVPPNESQFVDTGHKVYVGNLAKTVTTDLLKDFFSQNNAVSAKVQRDPGTSKSTGYGFVSFSSEEEAEAAISALNNAVLEGQKIRVNKA